MRTDKCTAPQVLDLPPKNWGRQVPVVIERRMLQSNLIQNRGQSFSLAVAAAAVAVCAPSATGRDRRQDMDAPRGAAARLRTASIKKRSRPRVCRPRRRRCHQDGHYNVVQVIDGTVVTIYSWIHPKKGLVWCLASANGFDVSHLKWGGDETYAEVLSELLAKSPTFLAATGLRLRRGLLCVDDVRLDFQTLERGRCYTIGFCHPNFHPMVADPPGVWNIQSVDLASGVVKKAGLRGIPRQAPYNREDRVRLVGIQDVRRRGIR